MIYHHIAARAVAQAHVDDLIAQAAADRLAALATSDRRRHRFWWIRLWARQGRRTIQSASGPPGTPIRTTL